MGCGESGQKQHFPHTPVQIFSSYFFEKHQKTTFLQRGKKHVFFDVFDEINEKRAHEPPLQNYRICKSWGQQKAEKILKQARTATLKAESYKISF